MKAVTAMRATQALIVLETALVAAPKHSARSRHGQSDLPPSPEGVEDIDAIG